MIKNESMPSKANQPNFHSLVTPNYNQRSPIVNDNGFSDKPTIGSPNSTWSPPDSAGALPNGPPKYIQPAGKRPIAKGLTNKRLPSDNL